MKMLSVEEQALEIRKASWFETLSNLGYWSMDRLTEVSIEMQQKKLFNEKIQNILDGKMHKKRTDIGFQEGPRSSRPDAE